VAPPARTILHVDMDAFFASIEQLDHPEWRGRPVIVGAAPDRRGVVAAASYEARAFGVRSAMPSREAGRRCPQAVFVRPRMARYAEMSERVRGILRRFTPVVEPVSIDEAVLDATGTERLWGDGEALARRIQTAIREELGLSASIGVASNRFLAKIASDLHKPGGRVVVPPDPAAVREFLAPLPVGRLWGVGQVTERRLVAAGVRTIGDVQRAGVAGLMPLLGRPTAEWLFALAEGRDDRPVGGPEEERSISREHTFETDCASRAAVEARLLELAADVGRRLREGGWYAGVLRLKVRWAPFRTVTRQRTVWPPLCDDFSLREHARALWCAEPMRQPVRLIGFGAAGLTRQPPSADLLESATGERRRRELVSRAMDELNRRYGLGAVRLAGGEDDGSPPRRRARA